MQKITPFLWFYNNAEEAVNLYTSLFKNSKIVSVARYGVEGPGPKGTAMTVAFQLEGQEFIALNGGPVFHFTEAISFVVNCENRMVFPVRSPKQSPILGIASPPSAVRNDNSSKKEK